jgi:cell division protein FtsI (penicillin-binding protein 3)
VDQSRLAFGYGLSASLLQMARAYTVFARDGEIVPVTMLRQEQPVAGVRVLSPQVARDVRKMLQMATETGGTATRAQAMGYSVGGKTGTAHAQEGGDYLANRHRAWFVGMAPMTTPRVVVAVMIDQPSTGGHFGGDVAAPVFSQVVQQTLRLLNVPPDLEVRRQIVAQALAQASVAPDPAGGR